MNQLAVFPFSTKTVCSSSAFILLLSPGPILLLLANLTVSYSILSNPPDFSPFNIYNDLIKFQNNSNEINSKYDVDKDNIMKKIVSLVQMIAKY